MTADRVLFLMVVAASSVAGCGAETATTAATSAAIKQNEVEQGEKTLEKSRQKVEQAARQIQERAAQGAAASEKQ